MSEEANLATIARLYAAMDAHDGEAMAACYAPTATFTDPVFVNLSDGEPQDMWRMLVGRSVSSLAITACAVLATCGGSPASIS